MNRPMRGHVLGSCWACGGRVDTTAFTRVEDAQGRPRLLHPGPCADRFRVQNTPKIEGGPDDTTGA